MAAKWGPQGAALLTTGLAFFVQSHYDCPNQSKTPLPFVVICIWIAVQLHENQHKSKKRRGEKKWWKKITEVDFGQAISKCQSRVAVKKKQTALKKKKTKCETRMRTNENVELHCAIPRGKYCVPLFSFNSCKAHKKINQSRDIVVFMKGDFLTQLFFWNLMESACDVVLTGVSIVIFNFMWKETYTVLWNSRWSYCVECHLIVLGSLIKCPASEVWHAACLYPHINASV